jgi:hypothetical protein
MAYPMSNSPHTASIDILDDDSLLNIFYLYRPLPSGEGDDEARLFGGDEGWDDGHWWYKLVHVCQRWRNLILGSASYLGLCLICTFGTPVADMLAHSPPLPLVVFYDHDDVGAKDEEGLILALEQRDRVRRIRLRMNISKLQEFIMVISEEYLILEYLVISIPNPSPDLCLMLPETLQAPHLRHLVLSGLSLPIGSRLLTTAVGLVSFSLIITNLSTYFLFQPHTLLQWISFMPQLETLMICSNAAFPTIERQVPIVTPITLPNLRWFFFQGSNAYLEAVVRQITTPRLEGLQIFFFEQYYFSVPCLSQFINTTKNLRFSKATLSFCHDQVDVGMYTREEADMLQSLHVHIPGEDTLWKVSAVAEISNSLSQLFSAVEHLTLKYDFDLWSLYVINRNDWHKILRSFGNVKTLRISNEFVEMLSHCLQSDDGELPLDLLPELRELTYSKSRDRGDLFTSFINVRQNAGRPITLVHL